MRIFTFLLFREIFHQLQITRSVITLACGQCGNQLSSAFFDQVLREHGITPDGTLKTDMQVDNKQTFFYETSSSHYTPRAILFDTESSVINRVLQNYACYRKDNSFVPKENIGAGNVWANGYAQAQNSIEHLLDVIDREVEACDQLSTFQLFHSISGGSGSGAGSLLIEKLSERYPKALLTTYSVFPSPDISDVIVQPYNAALSISKLNQFADATFVFQNSAVERQITGVQDNAQIAYHKANELIGAVASEVTRSSRFPTFISSGIEEIITSVVPVPQLKWLNSAVQLNKSQEERPQLLQSLLTLLHPNSLLSEISANSSVISTLALIAQHPSITIQQLNKTQQRLSEKHIKNYVGWNQESFSINIQHSNANNVLIENSCGINSLFRNTCQDFDKIFKQGTNAAFLAEFVKSELWSQEELLEELKTARESTQQCSDIYEKAEQQDFMNL